MARGRRRRAGFGFMMFQDIIMAVFGILILIVLYLMFNVETRNITTERALRKEIEKIQDEVFERRRRINDVSAELAAMAGASSRDRLLKERREVVRDIEHRIDSATSALYDVRERIGEREENIEKMLEAFEDHQVVRRAVVRVMEMEKELELGKQRLQELEEVYANFEAVLEGGPIFRPTAGFAAFDHVFFMEVSGGGLALFELRGEQIVEIADEAQRSAVFETIKRYPEQTRIMIFVRPTGIPDFLKLKRNFREIGVAFGYEPLPAGEPFRLVDLDYDPQSHESNQFEGGEEGGAGPDSSGGSGAVDETAGVEGSDPPGPSEGGAKSNEGGKTAPGEDEGSDGLDELEPEGADETAESEKSDMDWDLALLFILTLLGLLAAIGILSWRSKRQTGGIE